MPSLKDHEEQSTKRYENSFTELHKWMDEPSQMLSGSHRKFRHDPDVTPLEAKKMFGENADNACLDHIFLDKATSREKEKRKGKNNIDGKNRSIRLGNKLEDLMDKYAAFVGSDRSKVIREILTEGLFQRTKHVQFQRLQDYLAKREAFTLLEKCEKCGSFKSLGIYHIDGNIDNNVPNNLITLCVPCLALFEKFKLKWDIKEKFVEWFFLDSTESQ